MWYSDGSTKLEHSYHQGKAQGIHIEYFPNKNKRQENIIAKYIQYKNGQLHEQQLAFYPNGTLKAILHFDNGILNGWKASWNKEGVLIEEGIYQQGNLNGSFMKVLDNGKQILCNYKDNKLEGKYQELYPVNAEGKQVKALEAHYSYGLLDGEFSLFSPKRIKIQSAFYKKGQLEGALQHFDEKGRLYSVVEYKNGKQQGLFTEFYPNGDVAKEVRFDKGVKIGLEKYFGPNGQITRVANYNEQGELQGLIQEWNLEGVLTFEAEFFHGKRHGKFNKYYRDGRPKVIQNFSYDKLDGMKFTYNENGELNEQRYSEGEKNLIMHCWYCKNNLDLPEGPLSFKATCDHCNSWLHVCKNCQYYQPGQPNDCLVPETHEVDKEKANLCEEFKMQTVKKNSYEHKNINEASKKLFGDSLKSPDLSQSKENKFNQLFKDEI